MPPLKVIALIVFWGLFGMRGYKISCIDLSFIGCSKSLFILVLLYLANVQVASASGFYVTGSLGFAVQKPPSDGSASIGTASDVSERVAAGYLHTINDKWGAGLEVGYSYFGTGTFHRNLATFDITTSASDISAVATYKLNPKWTLLGQAGMAHIRSDVDTHLPHAEFEKYEHDVKPMIGFGARYHLEGGLSIDTTLLHYFGDTSVDLANPPDDIVPIVNQLLVGVHYSF